MAQCLRPVKHLPLAQSIMPWAKGRQAQPLSHPGSENKGALEEHEEEGPILENTDSGQRYMGSGEFVLCSGRETTPRITTRTTQSGL